MSTQAEPIPTPPTFAVQNTVGKGNEQTLENRTCPRRRRSRRSYSTSKSPEPTPSVFSWIRRDGSESHRHRDFERETVFRRLERKEKGVFNRLGENVTTKERLHRERKRFRKVKIAEEDTRIQDRKNKSQALKMTTYPNHGVTQSFSPVLEISFPPPGDGDGMEGLMIIEAEIGGYFIHRIYVDEGSASEILYEHCFNRLRPEAIPSTAHGMLKFLVPGRILTLRSSKLGDVNELNVQRTFHELFEVQPSAGTRVTEERIKVAIHPEYPEQTIAIGVPRYIAEHSLNVCEGCPPVRQKKRSQAPERNKAIQEEVERLMEVDIMKKVHYHSRLANPNAEETYQRLVEKALQKEIGRNLEVCVDDLVIKSRTEQEIIRDIEETFKTLREINMKLSPKKCTFEVDEGMFLGYMVNTNEIKVCLDKVEAVLILPRKRSRERSLDDRKGGKANASLLHFIVERPEDESLVTPMEVEEELLDPWTVFTDRLSRVDGSGAGLILTNSKGTKFTYALRFEFNATNNEADMRL
nr:reverse transcriptase domain-containing protein [Tanacetum cinerariifolium]